MTLSISVLGPLVTESDKGRFEKLPKKALAVLAFLAAQEGHAIDRERIARLLWDRQSEARHSLRSCLLKLRQALGPSAALHLVTDHNMCRLQNVLVDLDCFKRLSHSRDQSEMQAAVDLYRGEFLAGFDIGAEPFKEWMAVERNRTLTVVCNLVLRLATDQSRAGNHDAAIRFGRHLLTLDPLFELGQRALIGAYARAGRRVEALRQYKSCAATLKRELGVAPDGETQALVEAILRTDRAGKQRSRQLTSQIDRFRVRGA
jgi:DNA-binding SARP family transcriptional activator